MGFLFLIVITVYIVGISSSLTGYISQHILDDPLGKYRCDDYSKPTTLLNINDRVMDLINAEHFDNILRDTQDKMRTPSIIAFWNSSDADCTSTYNQIDFSNSVINELPSRAYLFAATYDIRAAPHRVWYKFIPERDLKSRFNIEQCPSLVFIPSKCNGLTNWCIDNKINDITYIGCNDYINPCTEYEILSNDNWINIMHEKLQQHEHIPTLNATFNSMQQQQRFLLSRDRFTLISELRNNYVSAALPAYSRKGYKTLSMPETMHKALFDFYIKHKTEHKVIEKWNIDDTKLNNHIVNSFIIDLNLNISFKEHIANYYIKPVMEEWLGFKLQLTSFYGLREYRSGHILKDHIDRIDIMVFSASLSIAHIASDEDGTLGYNTWPQDVRWPFEAVDFKGDTIRYDHDPGTMIIFESGKLIHGRPYPLPLSVNNGVDLIHIGAFCYFQPADASHFKLGHARNARNNINRFINGNVDSLEPLYYPPPNIKHKTSKKEL